MATNTTNYNLVKPADNETADISVINANMDKIDTQMKENADSMLKKDGTVQMTGVLKTVGGAGIAEQIELHNCHVYTDSTGHIWFANNLYFNGTEWRYKTDGAGIVFSISGSEAVLTAPLLLYVAEPGLKDAVATLSQTHVLTTETGLPLTGGTLTGNLEFTGAVPFVRLSSDTYSRKTMVQASSVANLINFLDNQNLQKLYVQPETLSIDLAVMVERRIADVPTTYKIYGEHNITVSTSAPSTTLANGAQHQVY